MSLLRFSDHSLRSQIALVFGTLVVGLAVLLSLGFGELLKLRIERDAGTALQVIAENAGKLLANGQSARYLLPDTVLDYIHLHQLYKST